MSIWVVLDLFNQFTNTRALSLLHNRKWQSRKSEVHVHLVHHCLLVTKFVTVYNGLPRSIMYRFIFNVEALAVIRWTCSDCSCFNNGLPRSIMFDNFFMKRTCFDLLRTGRFSSTWRDLWVGSNNGLPRSNMIWVWIWLVWLGTFELLHNLSRWLLTIFWTQFSLTVVFQGDLWRRPRWRKNFLVYDFSSFHPNKFRNTKARSVSWRMIAFDRVW